MPAKSDADLDAILSGTTSMLNGGEGRRRQEYLEQGAKLEDLKAALVRIEPASFSRYHQLLKLLNSGEYGWNVKTSKDRIVLFTERIETMRFLAAQLRKDLKLNEQTVQEMYGFQMPPSLMKF